MDVFNKGWEPFDRVNLISEIFKSTKKNHPSTSHSVVKTSTQKNTISAPSAGIQDFELYKKPQLITNFQTGNVSALPSFMEKLQRLKKGEKVKIRIAYFGDSMIEGDLMTQTLRTLFQEEYGGAGVGYLPITSNVSAFRHTATMYGNNWEDTNFMNKTAKDLYLSGHYFTGKGQASYIDNTIKTTETPIEKSLIYKKTTPGNIGYNGGAVMLPAEKGIHRQILSTDNGHQIKIASLDPNAIYYGVSFESESGIFVDNFSFRGITGVELNKLQESFLKEIQEANHYDLIVLQYGVNLMFRPQDTDYSYYTKMMTPVLRKLKNAFSDADFLLISSADRAFKYEDGYKTAIGMSNLLETQANLAFENQFAFYNLFQTMGGENSIVKWAEEHPALANKDYVHPNHKGAEILAKKLFEAFQNDYQKYTMIK